MTPNLYKKAELAEQTVADLRVLAGDHGLEFDTERPTKIEVITALLVLTPEDALVNDEDNDEVEDEELDDEDEELDDEELEEEEADEVVPVTKAKAKAPAKPAAPAKTKAAPKGDGDDTLAAKQVASLLGTEAKTLRQFLRSPASTFEPVGSGGRYEFTNGDVPQIKEEFDAWRAAHAARGSKRTTKPAAKEIEEIEEGAEIEELDDDIDDEDLELDDEEED